jgi:TRAP-type mannitol/chloroaromatic compound transport system permease large subunit
VIKLAGVDMTWFLILIALMLQTSFLTPPVGFSLFYLKGVVPKGVTIKDIYLGVIPFVLLQMAMVALCLVSRHHHLAARMYADVRQRAR